MNEVLLKRLLGAGVLVVGTLILANLLPEPQVQPPPDASLTRVTYSLRPSASPPEPIAAAPQPESATVEIAQAPPAPELPVVSAPPAPIAAPVEKPVPAPKAVRKPQPRPVAKAPEPQAARKDEPLPVPEPEAQLAKAEAVEPTPAAAEPRPQPEPGPKPEPKTAAAPATATGSWFVQIGAFALEANASKSVQKLQNAGMSARQDTVTFKAGPRYRVRTGPYASREEAETQRARAAGIGFGDARVALE